MKPVDSPDVMHTPYLTGARTRVRKLVFLLSALFALSLMASTDAEACRAYGGLIDGFVDRLQRRSSLSLSVAGGHL